MISKRLVKRFCSSSQIVLWRANGRALSVGCGGDRERGWDQSGRARRAPIGRLRKRNRDLRRAQGRLDEQRARFRIDRCHHQNGGSTESPCRRHLVLRGNTLRRWQDGCRSEAEMPNDAKGPLWRGENSCGTARNPACRTMQLRRGLATAHTCDGAFPWALTEWRKQVCISPEPHPDLTRPLYKPSQRRQANTPQAGAGAQRAFGPLPAAIGHSERACRSDQRNGGRTNGLR